MRAHSLSFGRNVTHVIFEYTNLRTHIAHGVTKSELVLKRYGTHSRASRTENVDDRYWTLLERRIDARRHPNPGSLARDSSALYYCPADTFDSRSTGGFR